MSTLAIVSHTPHYLKNGIIYSWGATAREIDHLTGMFDRIYHIAPLHQGSAPESALPYTSDKITHIPLRPSGGQSLWAKLHVLLQAPANLHTIHKALKQVDIVQFRAPTGMGIYVLPYLSWCSRKPRWVKYAGNWSQPRPPLGYAFQRWWLRNNFQKSPVTINGKWPGQQPHLLTFENPCLTDEELKDGKATITHKNYSGPLNACFIGRLEDAKGVRRILQALQQLPHDTRIGTITFIGDGPERTTYERMAASLPFDTQFMGYQNRHVLINTLKKSHLLLLPSDSEGFPKVVAEAANYGALPFTSDVSSLPQYIRDGENGWITGDLSPDNLARRLLTILVLSPEHLKTMAEKSYEMGYSFSFNYYNERVYAILKSYQLVR